MTIFSATIAAEDLKMEKLFGNVQNAKTICFAPIATSWSSTNILLKKDQFL